MENFIFSLNATVPVFLVILLGGILKKCGMMPEAFTSAVDKHVFRVALPVLLFYDIATTDLSKVFEWKFVFFCMGVTTLMFLGTWGLTVLLCRDKSIVGAFAQGSVRGSAAILGIAFVNNIYGNSGMAPLMIVSAVPLYNIFSVMILTFSAAPEEGGQASGGQDRGKLIRRACLNILKNPIIIGIFAGLLATVIGLKLPVIASKTLSSISATATPMALLSVGASFKGRAAIARLKPTMLATFWKLLLMPAAFFPLALSLGFRQSELVAILVMLGSPTTVSCYIMAKNMGNDAQLTSSIIVMTTILSSLTLTFWIFLLRSMGYI